jgi:sugar phosphate isomerase/epimerase
MPLPELARLVRGLGFDAVELPVRPGFQVEPQNVTRDLPMAAKVLGDQGLTILSVAGTIDEQTIDACAEAGARIIRVCWGIEPANGYQACVDEFRRRCESVMPYLRRASVTVGLQNHHGNDIGSAIGLIDAIAPLDPAHVSVVLDVAHCALAGEPEEIAIDVAWPRLCMVNLKNGIRRRIDDDDDESGEARWKVHWTTGRQGYASWAKTAQVLTRRGYSGPICLCAEYGDESALDASIRQDVAYALTLLQNRRDG